MHVDIEERDFAFSLNLEYLLLGCAVHVSVHLAVLDELVLSDHLLKGRHIHEVVVCAIDFSRAWTSRSVGDAEAEAVRIAILNQALDHSAFANAGRTQNHQRSELLALVELRQRSSILRHLLLKCLASAFHRAERTLIRLYFAEQTSLGSCTRNVIRTCALAGSHLCAFYRRLF